MTSDEPEPRVSEHSPRHGRLRRSHAGLTLLKTVGIATAVAVIAAGGIGAFELTELGRQVADNSIDISNGTDAATPLPVPHIGAIEGGFNFLLVGTDNDAAQGDAYGVRDATLNDVNILLHVSADHTSGVVVSLPRDLIVPHPDCVDPDTGEEFYAMSARPLNEAWSRGGLGCVVATVSELTGQPISYAGTVSFNGVIAMTDAIGGVPVCVEEAIDDPDAALVLPAGTSVISGATALGFLRSRHGVGDGSDLSRISSQQTYMSSLMRTMKSADTLGNLGTLYSLARAATANVKLSSNLSSLDSIVAMAYALKDVDLDRLVFVQYPGGTSDPDFPGKVVPYTELADELFAAISADQPFTLDENSLGNGTVLDPDATPTPTAPEPDPAVTETPAPEATEDPEVIAAGVPEAAPAAAAPTVIEGLKGITATTQTCAAAYSG
ncbi:MAG: LCP family protein [Leifsonia flava]